MNFLEQESMIKLIDTILTNYDDSDRMFNIAFDLCEFIEHNEKYNINKLEYNDYTDVEEKLQNYLSDIEKNYNEKLGGLMTGRLIRVCERCGCEVVYDDLEDFVSRNYDCACLVCDEDLYLHETKLIPKEEVKMFISEEDKEYYLKHGYLPSKFDEVTV